MLQEISNKIFGLEQKSDEIKDDIHKIDMKVEKWVAEGKADHKHIHEAVVETKEDVDSHQDEISGLKNDVNTAKTSIKLLKGLGSFILALFLIAGAVGAVWMVLK